MNRRKFFISLSSAAMISALPLSIRAAGIVGSMGRPDAMPAWNSIQACREDCGLSFRGSGPVRGRFRLEAVDVHRRDDRQFTAIFSAPPNAPEGLYEFGRGRDTTALFLQPIHGQPGRMQAVFNLAG